MPRKTTSQWEFGDLFDQSEAETPAERSVTSPSQTRATQGAGRRSDVSLEKASRPAEAPQPDADEGRRIVTVGELTLTIRRLLEGRFTGVWVTGEITNLRRQSSGHIYFSLKDSRSQLSCVLFRGERVSHRDLLEDGAKVLLGGDVTVYEPRGQYQLRVQAIELQGVGALQAAFEKLKKKLQIEGLFAQERKRPLPRYPQRIGLVTSATGAAIRDVLHVMERRQPGLEVVLAPCRVQGEGAAEEIADRIRLLNQWSEGREPKRQLDLILVTRGGGSLEDLWAFNEEVVARAVHGSVVPVVSAVGHEIDFTICDFVADVRAATPSAAAEIITEGVFSSRQFVAESARTLQRLARRRLNEFEDDLGHLLARLERLHPRRLLNDKLQHLDDLQTALARSARRSVREQRIHFENLNDRLGRVRPALILDRQQTVLSDLARRLRQQSRLRLTRLKGDFGQVSARLKLLGPGNTLARGYSITTDAASGAIVRSAGQVPKGGRLRTRLHEGEVTSVVESATQRRRPT